MKISGTGPTRTTGPDRKKRTESGGGGSFASHLEQTADTGGAEGVHGSSSVAGVGSILAAQAVPDSTDQEGRRRLVQRGDDILDRLEELRRAILAGAVPKERLANLAQMLRAKRQRIDDPLLLELIDEIELRAEVEIAKLTRQS